MTLNLLTQVPEGLIMLADSMVSAEWTIDGRPERINFEHARKLFHLGSVHPAAAMVNGDATIGDSSLGQLIRDASRALDEPQGDIDHEVCLSIIAARISAVFDPLVRVSQESAAAELSADAQALGEINKKRQESGKEPITSISSAMIGVRGLPQDETAVAEVPVPRFTVVVGSYFTSPLASSLTWPGATREDLVTQPSGGGLWWWGSGSVALIRLIKGVDLDVLFSDDGAENADRDAALRYFEARQERYGMNTALEIMPVQQAIYFSEYLAGVAAGYDRFKAGPHTVGGEIDVVALIDRKLRWIHKQRLISSIDSSSGHSPF
jgi:hypothetical protein